MATAIFAPSSGAFAAAVQVTATDLSGNPLTDAVVFLESPEAKALSKPQTGIEIEQTKKQFSPRVVVAPVGSSISFPNHDPVQHQVYSFSPAKTFELKLYKGTPSSPVVFDKAGVAVLGCNIHDLMTSWVILVETPYFGKSDSAGHIKMASVPSGTYRLKAWHPSLPPGAPLYEQTVNVASAPLALSFAIKGLIP